MTFKTETSNRLNYLRWMIALTLSFVFLSTGCQLDSSNANSTKAINGGVEIFFFNTQSRTLQPDTELTADSYRIIGSGPDNKTLDQTADGGSSIQLTSIEVGDWNFIVEAFNADGYLYSRGSFDVTIEAGVLAEETVTLSILQDTGSFSLSIEVPNTLSETPFIVGTLQTDLQPDIPLSFVMEPGSTGYSKHTASLNNSVPAGYYTLSVTVYDDSNMRSDPSRYTGFADSVRILEGITTVGTYTLNDAPGIEATLNIEFNLNDVIDVSFDNAAALPTDFNYHSATQYMLIPSIPLDDIDAANLNYEWFVNGQSISTDYQYEINSMGRLGTRTVSRATDAPTLDFNEFIMGTQASITSTISTPNTVIGNFASFANGGQGAEINFNIEITDTNNATNIINIHLNETELLAWGVIDVTAVTIDELNMVIEQQIMTSPYSFLLNTFSPAPMALTDNTGLNGGSITFTPVNNVIYDLTSLGFATDNRSNSGIPDKEANNRINLEIIGYGPMEVIIPAATYASANDLASAIQLEVEAFSGPDQLSVTAINNRLVFTNEQLGSAFGVIISPSYTLTPEAGIDVLINLKIDNLEITAGIDEHPGEPRYLPGQYTVNVVAKNTSGTRSGSATYHFEVNAD